MSSDPRKAGPIIHTIHLTNFALRKRKFEQLIHVIPVNPEFKTKYFAKQLASFLGPEFAAALHAKLNPTWSLGPRRKRAAN